MTASPLSFYIFIAILVGTLMPIQGGVNSMLSKSLNHPIQSAFISFLGGAFLCGIALPFLKTNFPLSALRNIPPLYFCGGILGICFVFTSILLIDKIGATVLLGSFVTGQLIMSLVMDHYGWLGVPSSPLSWTRISGVFFLLAGLILITRK